MTELNRPTQTDLDNMSHAVKDALILVLFDRLEEFGGRLKELEGKVEKTSKHSSKPPSSDGLKKEGGGQAAQEGGKAGRRRARSQGFDAQRVDNPDRVEELRPQGFCDCGICLGGRAAATDRCPNPRRRLPNTGRRTSTARAGMPTRRHSASSVPSGRPAN